jgi:hypothetical protein
MATNSSTSRGLYLYFIRIAGHIVPIDKQSQGSHELHLATALGDAIVPQARVYHGTMTIPMFATRV